MKYDVVDFYDSLVADYHLIYKDWDSSVTRQGKALDRLIRARIPSSHPLSLLDCSCGIGTQAIGLAKRGYRVKGTDLSPASIKQARREAKRLKARVAFGVADFRNLAGVQGRFDAVISCDNALTHLLTLSDLSKALRNMREKLAPGGFLLLSIRDYDALLRERPSFTAPVVYGQPGASRVYFQIWEWEKGGPVYKMHLFLISQFRGKWKTISSGTRQRAMKRMELTDLLKKTGFEKIRWHEPKESGFYQPIVTALRK